MKLFRFPKRDPKRFEEETLLMQIVRYIIIIALFAGVALGIWMNSQRQAALLNKSPGVRSDATGNLSDEQRGTLHAYAEKFQYAYGIPIRIMIQDESFPEQVLAPAERASTFVFGLSPRHKQVHLEIPPLMLATLGETFPSYLRHEHFAPYFAQGNWEAGLASALSLLAEKLDQALLARDGQR